MIARAYLGVETKQLTYQVYGTSRHLEIAGTWRLTQDIIRFDPELYRALTETSLEGDISFAFLRRLPAWCVYIETPGLILNLPEGSSSVDGFWAMIDYDIETRIESLSLSFLDNDNGALSCCDLPIDENGTLSDAVERMCQIALSSGAVTSKQVEKGTAWMREAAPVALNLLLYACSYWKPTGGGSDGKPCRPEQKKIKKGKHFFPAKSASVVELGTHVGDAIRAYREHSTMAEEPTPNGGRARHSPRPHIRRAHWHGYWTGPRNPGETQESRRFVLKWIPPIPVALSKDGEADPS